MVPVVLVEREDLLQSLRSGAFRLGLTMASLSGVCASTAQTTGSQALGTKVSPLKQQK